MVMGASYLTDIINCQTRKENPSQTLSDFGVNFHVVLPTQTRILHFEQPSPVGNGTGTPPSGETATRQGYSVASWTGQRPRNPQAGPGQAQEGQGKEGFLKVLTNHMRPGYLRKNGVPYSANAVLEE